MTNTGMLPFDGRSRGFGGGGRAGFMIHLTSSVKSLEAAEAAAEAVASLKIYLEAEDAIPMPQRGSDLRYDLEISFEEASLGCEKEIPVTKLDGCEECQGSGAAPGSRSVSCTTCRGKGQVATSRGIFTFTQTCPRCEGSGKTIEKPCKRCNGAGRKEKTSKIRLRIPPGVDTGARIRSTGKGETGLRGGLRGPLCGDSCQDARSSSGKG